jgi:sugar phosphate isomerase/epimerase
MPIKVGLQLHTVREALRFDLMGTLEKVAAIGYRFVEISQYDASAPDTWFGADADALRAKGNALGLKFVGGQVKNLSEATADRSVKFYRDLGSEHITIPIGYFPNGSALDEACGRYNAIGRIVRSNGMRLFYANHYHEWQRVDGGPVIDALMARTDPAFLGLSFSPYWVMRGLLDPIAIFRKYRGRIGLIEQADFPRDQINKLDMWNFAQHHPIAKNINRDVPLKGGEIENIHPLQAELFTEIGDGILGLQELIDEANHANTVAYVLLRQDFTRRPTEFESIERSMKNYQKIRGVVWQ